MLLVTGADGQLGQSLKQVLPDALYTDVAQLDITQADAVKSFVDDNGIDTIINCAAYTNVDKAEDEVAKCYEINTAAVRNLALTGTRIIHISTDYVFNGTKPTPYVETDDTLPLGVYGSSKLAGEKAVMDIASTAVILRTSWLYSPYGNNFLKTMQRLGAERDTLSVVFDQTGTPTYAPDLAATIVRLLPEITAGTKEIYHFTNEGVTSWYDFAVTIMKLSGLPCHVLPIESSEYKTKAVRPSYSVLNKAKIKKTFGMEIPYWKESLETCLKKF